MINGNSEFDDHLEGGKMDKMCSQKERVRDQLPQG
jgi:hypothetical protein